MPSSLKTFVAKVEETRKVAVLAHAYGGVTLGLRKGLLRFPLAVAVVVARPEGRLAYSVRSSRKLSVIVLSYGVFGFILAFLARKKSLGLLVFCLLGSLVTIGVWLVRFYLEKATLEAEIQSIFKAKGIEKD